MSDPPAAPPRGFPADEYAGRVERAQTAMAAQGLDALLLSTEPELAYFGGFQTPFWQSPTRPFFLVVPAAGKPVAVVPAIAEARMRAGWLDDVRTWPSPQPDDEGVGLLADTLLELAGDRARIGVPQGPETRLGLPLGDARRLCECLPHCALEDATGLVRELRMVKSELEIAKIAHVCDCTSAAFEGVADWLRPGLPESHVFRRFRIACLEAGVDAVPYLVGGAGPDGPAEVIAPASDLPAEEGDVLILDTGATFDGYYCDFDRCYAVGTASEAARGAYEVLFEATEAGFAAARPGATCAEVHRAMHDVLAAAGAADGAVGRLGHGLGLQLTEWPSHTPADRTELRPGMVLTLEPSMAVAPGRVMVHEEDIVIRDDGPAWLTRRAPARLPVVGA